MYILTEEDKKRRRERINKRIKEMERLKYNSNQQYAMKMLNVSSAIRLANTLEDPSERAYWKEFAKWRLNT